MHNTILFNVRMRTLFPKSGTNVYVKGIAILTKFVVFEANGGIIYNGQRWQDVTIVMGIRHG